jgi:DNA-binding SARP family transcriptional activator/tetratricopeptide (TPR) repeat protein
VADPTEAVTLQPAAGARAYLLGPPRIERAGKTVAVDTRKAVALLAYLAFTGRPQSRDHLATLLWPEADQTRARSALRRTLSSLNTALDGEGLRVERESLAYSGDGVWVDLVAFREASSADDPGRWEEAAGLWGGDFLAGFVLRDSPEFDDWQLAASDDLRTEFSATLERLARAKAATDPDAAITFAKRWLDLDPLHEAAHRTLMRLYDDTLDRTAALRQYRSCVAALERELGVEPLDETTDLYESIRQSRPEPSPEPVVPLRGSADLPFVGRDTEIGELIAAYGSVGRDGRLAVIDGEAGIGKTRLATEFLTVARERGAVVLDARCHPEEELLAFGTCVELLRSIPADRVRAAPVDALIEAARLVPDLSPDAPGATALDSPAARRRLFEGIADVLAACVGVGGVLFVDDAHWIDESSRDVLRFLVRRLKGRSVFVLLTWRSEEVGPSHALRRMLASEQRASSAAAVSLGRLERADVASLVRLVDASDALGATLYDETAGVPFFVAEYLRGDGSDEPMPTGVRDLLASRVERVGRGASQVLSAAAVLGRAFDPSTVRETSGRTDEEVAAALDELTALNLIAESDDRYDFTHPKLRSYVYEATTLGRRRILHARAAKALMRRARRHPELVALGAHHLERAGEEDEAAVVFKEAGEHARSVFANAEALAHYRSALALGHPDAADLHEAVGDLLTLQGRYAEAIASHEKAAALGADLSVIGRKLGGVHHRLGDWASADTHYTEAEESLDGRPGLARLLAERSLNAHRAGLDDAARDLAARSLEVARAEGDGRSLAQAHNIGGILATRRREVKVAREHLQASLEISEELGDLPATAASLNNLALALRAEGGQAIALHQSQQALEITRMIGDRHREAAVLSNLADILRDLGRGDEAMEHVKRSVAILTDIGEADEPLPEIWKLVEW